MVWLQSNERHEVLGQFDPSTCVLKEVERSTLGDITPAMPHGFYSYLGDLRIGVYGVAGKLFLVIDDQLLELATDDTIEVSGPRDARHLRVVNKVGQAITEATYSLRGLAGSIPNDSTPFVEDEDFDIGLLASNVSKDPERRSIFTDK
jgi:hypothetical protein